MSLFSKGPSMRGAVTNIPGPSKTTAADTWKDIYKGTNPRIMSDLEEILTGKVPRGSEFSNGMDSGSFRERLLLMRLFQNDRAGSPFQSLSTALTEEDVYVFILHNDKPLVLKDERGLFPSDTLLTQLRILL